MDITLIEGCEKLAVQIVQVMAENVQLCHNYHNLYVKILV